MKYYVIYDVMAHQYSFFYLILLGVAAVIALAIAYELNRQPTVYEKVWKAEPRSRLGKVHLVVKGMLAIIFVLALAVYFAWRERAIVGELQKGLASNSVSVIEGEVNRFAIFKMAKGGEKMRLCVKEICFYDHSWGLDAFKNSCLFHDGAWARVSYLEEKIARVEVAEKVPNGSCNR